MIEEMICRSKDLLKLLYDCRREEEEEEED